MDNQIFSLLVSNLDRLDETVRYKLENCNILVHLGTGGVKSKEWQGFVAQRLHIRTGQISTVKPEVCQDSRCYSVHTL